MDEEIAAFLRYLATERNVSSHTLAAYGADLGKFREFVTQERTPDFSATAVDHLLIRRYLALLHKQCRKSTIGRNLASIRAFFKYLVREGKDRKIQPNWSARPSRKSGCRST